MPHVVCATPGRLLALAKEKAIDLSHVKHFVVDEVDQVLEQLGCCFPSSRTRLDFATCVYL